MANQCRVLVIDDNPDIHSDFQKILGPSWHSAETPDLLELESALFAEPAAPRAPVREFDLDSALQGNDGFQKVRDAEQAGEPYHVVFVDMRMPPGWDGVRTTREILKAAPNSRIVICTAYSEYTPEEISKALGVGPDRIEFRRKPFNPDEIMRLAVAATSPLR